MALALLSCNKPVNDYVSTPPPLEPVVHVYNLAGQMSPAILEQFTARTKIQVAYEEYASMDRLVSDLQLYPARWDVVIARDSVVSQLRELKLLTAMNLSELPGLKNMEWRFLDLPFDPGNRYSVPYLWGVTVLAYRQDLVMPPPKDWLALWDPAYAGQIMMPDNRREAFGLAMLANEDSMDEWDEKAMEQAGEALLKQAPGVRAYASSARIASALVAGEIALAPLPSGEAVKAAERDPAIGFILPERGALRWMDQFVIPRDAQRLAEAYAFVNFFFDPETAARNADALKYATPNKASEPFLDAAIKTNAVIYPEAAALARCKFYPPVTAPFLRIINNTWTKARELQSQNPAPAPLPLAEAP